MSVAAKGISRKGTPYVIRYPEKKDAKSLLTYINRLSKERTFILLQGEQLTLKEEKDFIKKQQKAFKEKNGLALLLVIEDKVAGVANARGKKRAQKHIAELGLSVSSSFRGEGLGEKLLTTLLVEIKKNMPQVRMVILGVLKPNVVAQKLYKKIGFKRYGSLAGGAMNRGKYVDEIFMYRPLQSLKRGT